MTIVCIPMASAVPRECWRDAHHHMGHPVTPTRGFAAEGEPGVAVCLLPGTELAFEQDVKYDRGWIWARTTSFRACQGWCGRTKCAASPSRRDRISRWKQCPGDAARQRPASDCAAIASCPSDIGAHHKKAEEHGSTPAAASAAGRSCEVPAMPSGVSATKPEASAVTFFRSGTAGSS